MPQTSPPTSRAGDPRLRAAGAADHGPGVRRRQPGADHNRSGAYEADFLPHADRLHGSPESARLAVETEDRAALLDSLILCKFLRGVFADLFAEGADLLARVTGWDVTAEELRTTARRIVTAKKLFNLREGWTPDGGHPAPAVFERGTAERPVGKSGLAPGAIGRHDSGQLRGPRLGRGRPSPPGGVGKAATGRVA